MYRLERTEQVLLLGFCTLLVLPLLYIARGLDNNTLTSWRWVFGETGFVRSILLLLGVVPVALLGAGSRLPERPAALAALAVVAVLPAWAVPEMIVDASRYFVAAKYVEEYGLRFFFDNWGGAVPAWTDLPLVPALYGLVFRFLGETREWIQLFNTLVFSGTVVLTCLIGKTLWSGRAGFAAGMMLLGMPYLLTQVPMMLVDLHTMFFLVLSVYALVRALDADHLRWVPVAGIATGLLLLSKYSAWGLVPVLPAAAWLSANGNMRRRLVRFGSVAVIAVVVAGAFLVPSRELVARQIGLLLSYNGPALAAWEEGFVSTFLYQMHPFITVAFLAALVHGVRIRDRRFLVAAGLLLLPLLGIRRIRYLVPLFPFLALAAGYGLAALRHGWVRRAVTLCVVGTSLVITHGVYVPFLQGTSMGNLCEAGAYIDARGFRAVDVYAGPQAASSGNTAVTIPLLDLYTKAEVRSPRPWRPLRPPAKLGTMPLRFTWEMTRPPFYDAAAPGTGQASVFIRSERVGEPPVDPGGGEGCEGRSRVFDRDSGVFRFRAIVEVQEGGPCPERGSDSVVLAYSGQPG